MRGPGLTGVARANLPAALTLLCVLLAAGCRLQPPPQTGSPQVMPSRDINAVLRDHDRELLAIPGVVGVFVGLQLDGKTLCLKVMVVRKTAELERRIPKSIEGYAVTIEESGVLRPLR